MKKLATGIGLLFFFIVPRVFAQGEIEEQGKIFYKNERTFAVLLNSDGFGANYRFGKRMTAFKNTLYDIDFVGVKHPREQKITTETFYLTRRIVYGKLNECFNLRAGIGLEKEMYSKYDRGGISIRRYFTLGPDIAITKPIYYDITIYQPVPNSNIWYTSTIVDKFQKFQHISSSTISGKASFFKGFNEIGVIPGVYGKLGFVFEFGKSQETIHAIDAGAVLSGFIKKVEIMATDDNKQFFLSLFVSYRFGKSLDARFKQKKNKIDDMLNQY